MDLNRDNIIQINMQIIPKVVLFHNLMKSPPFL